MRGHLSAALLSIICLCGASGGEFTIVKNLKIEGAIIPAETVLEWHRTIRGNRDASHGIQDLLGVKAESFWTPETKDVEVAESHLRAALERAEKKPVTLFPFATTPHVKNGVSHQLHQILEHYEEYRRQYIGLIVRGRRYLYINSFLAQEEPSYTEKLVLAMDGGFWYWHTLYSVDKRRFITFSINGDA